VGDDVHLLQRHLPKLAGGGRRDAEVRRLGGEPPCGDVHPLGRGAVRGILGDQFQVVRHPVELLGKGGGVVERVRDGLGVVRAAELRDVQVVDQLELAGLGDVGEYAGRGGGGRRCGGGVRHGDGDRNG